MRIPRSGGIWKSYLNNLMEIQASDMCALDDELMLRFAKDFYNRAKNWHLVSWIPYLPECIEVIDRCILERDYKLIHGVLRFDRHLAYRCKAGTRDFPIDEPFSNLYHLVSFCFLMIYLLTTISDIISHIVFITNRCKPRSFGVFLQQRPKMQVIHSGLAELLSCCLIVR